MKNYPKYNVSSLNYMIITGLVFCLVLGFILLHLGSKHNSDFLALTLSPILILTTFKGIIYTILKD